MKVYLIVVAPTALFILSVLFWWLRKLFQKQVDDQVDKFANEAKIPIGIRNRIEVRIKWR